MRSAHTTWRTTFCCMAIATSLSGCAADPMQFPQIVNLREVPDTVMSEDDRKAALAKMTAEKSKHREAAIKEIEKR